jgi:diguanylate cyclase (GGDEF)-like protein/putative nucleotidyltransferase with HDIG domain
MRRISTTYKLTALLTLLSVAPVLFLILGLTSREIQQVSQSRLLACRQLALSCSLHLRQKDYSAVAQLLDQFFQSSEGLDHVRLIRFDGLIIHQIGKATEASDSLSGAADGRLQTDPNNIQISILRGTRQWGSIEASYFDDLAGQQLWQILRACTITVAMNLFTFGILLRRSLSVLDSANAVPRRVRNTLDTIAGGVVILDAQRRIVMANEAFLASCHTSTDSLVGGSLKQFNFRCESEMLPWDAAATWKQRQSGVTVFLEEEQVERCFVVNATPIFDSQEKLAGTLVSFEDVTTLEQQKQSLLQTMSELQLSKEQIHQQNVRLQELASKDALTGTFNRRSLFEQLEELWTGYRQQKTIFNCIMLDVDHFKKLNDNHGHAVGDQVLREVSRTIKEAVQERGMVGRYGGEEFCIVLSGIDVRAATQVGEEVRLAIESNLAEPYRVTASFGVSGVELGAASFQAMLEQADQALYAAKHGGRNAVRCWSAELEVAEEQVALAKISMPTADNQPISYHAVASLHAALAYRDADTALHSQRVAEMAVTLARGLMTVSQLYVLEIAALLHDIGKIGVPDAILLKPAKLTAEEWKVMEAHARMGVEIVDSSFNSKALSDIVRYHHFRFDGMNTPEGGPVGEDIPVGARIVCIVDAFDAMVSNRVYRKGRSAELAFEELRRCAGGQFDPQLVERFIELQAGWRPDSRFMHSGMEDKLAISIGHLTERTMHAFESHDVNILSESLSKLATTGELYDFPAIKHLATELKSSIEKSRTNDWDEALPILQNLLDMCLMVQRAHIRDVAARPQVVENCPQSSYYETARAWWERDQV